MEAEDRVVCTTGSSRTPCWYDCFRTKTTSSHPHSGTSYSHQSIFDLTNIGLLLTLPFGAFVVAGQVGKDVAGPSGMLCVFFACVTASLSGLCFAELRSRVYRSQGTAYEYIYTVGGEILACLAGWALLLHRLSCSAALARSVSSYLDSLTSYRITNFTAEHVTQLTVINSSFDFVSLLVVIVTMLLLIADIQISNKRPMRMFWNIATTGVLCFLLVVGVYHLDFSNWKTTSQFFQGGSTGVFTGSALFLTSFSGFTCAMRTADFTYRGMKTAISLSTSLTCFISVLLLIALISSMTLLLPSTTWVSEAPLAEAFSRGKLFWTKYISNPCAILLLLPIVVVQLVEAKSLLMQMANDGVVFKILSAGSGDDSDNKFSSILTVLILGILAGCAAMLFNLTSLVSVASLTFIIVHIISALVILALRYRPTEESANQARKRRDIKRRLRKTVRHTVASRNSDALSSYGSTGAEQAQDGCHHSGGANPVDHNDNNTDGRSGSSASGGDNTRLTSNIHSSSAALSNDVTLLGQNESLNSENEDSQLECSSSDTDVDDAVEEYHFTVCTRVLTERRREDFTLRTSTLASYRRALLGCVGFFISACSSAAIVIHGDLRHNPVVITLLTIFLVLVIVFCCIVARQPVDNVECSFLLIHTPCVPYLPLVTIFILLHMAVSISSLPWIITSIWITLGMMIYGLYGIRHSIESGIDEHRPAEQRGLLPLLLRAPRPRTSPGTYSRLVIQDI